MIQSMREKSKDENVKYDYCEIEAKNVELENSVAKLLSKNDHLCNEINHENEDLKAQIQDKVFVITSLKNDLRKIKGKEIVDIALQIPSANTIIPGMFKLDLEPLAPRLLQNREAHIDYLKYTQEQADILWEIVEQAKAEHPLDKDAKKVDVTPKNKVKKVRFVEPLISSSNRLKCSTSKSGSKPTGNKRNDRISQTPSRNMKNKVESQPRKVNKKKCVVKPVHDVNVKHSLLHANSEPVCATCSSKKAKIVASKNANHSEPNHTWGSNATDIPSSSSSVMTAVMSSASSAITYTSVYTDSEPGIVFWGADDEEITDGGIPRVIVYGYDRLPMQLVAPPSPDYIPGPEDPLTPPVPQDEDEREPMFIQPHDLDYVPEPIYPEYIPLEDDHVLPVEEQPLPPINSPTTESPGYVTESDPEEDPKEYEDDETEDGPVDYPMDGGDDGDDDDGDSSRAEADNEDEDEEDEEEEEEHLAPADSVVVVPTVELVSPPERT
ncbi:hypothetical protein Tco_0479219 [Tanacetum coccineum]